MSKNHDAIKNDPRWKLARRLCIERDEQCMKCGATDDLTADHILALELGGDPFDETNLQCLCRRCNGAKQDTFEGDVERVTWVNESYPAIAWLTDRPERDPSF